MPNRVSYIAPPPDFFLASYDEAYNALRDHGMEHGYGFVEGRSKAAHSDKSRGAVD